MQLRPLKNTETTQSYQWFVSGWLHLYRYLLISLCRPKLPRKLTTRNLDPCFSGTDQMWKSLLGSVLRMSESSPWETKPYCQTQLDLHVTYRPESTLAPATVVEATEDNPARTFTLTTHTEEGTHATERERGEKLLELLQEPDLPLQEKQTLLEFLIGYHHVFSLEDGERGETDLVQMAINTGAASPKKQPTRRIPFTLRQEVARQLDQMQKQGVIQPSRSPWASPVVLVRKHDGSHRFCVDYRGLNSVMKPDSYPLPRIEDLLDQLGQSAYFSSIDLASGFWQIRMHPDSQEKTAFTTQQGLFEFRVMPFGLTIAPAVFQRLMQQVITPLNPSSGPDFVSVYLDDILVFSRTLEQHLQHLKTVIDKLSGVGLKLKPSKCRFAQEELEYLGHMVSRGGLKTSPRLVEAFQQFPVLRSVHNVRRFLGLLSYYRKFIRDFAKIARPLHQLTCKNTLDPCLPVCLRRVEGAPDYPSGVGLPLLPARLRARDRRLYRWHRSSTWAVPG